MRRTCSRRVERQRRPFQHRTQRRQHVLRSDSASSADGDGSSAISAPIVRARQVSGNPTTAAGRPVRSTSVGLRGSHVMNFSSCSAIQRATPAERPGRLARPRSEMIERLAATRPGRRRPGMSAGNHSCRLAEQRVGDFPWFERGVDRPDQLNKRVAAIQPLLQSVRPMAKTSGQICLSAAGGGWIGARCSRHLREKANSR